MNELKKYKKLTTFLGQVLGENYEVVLHWKDENNSFYIAAIENSVVSGRTINSPITDLALKLVQEKVYEEKDYVANYVAKAKSNHKVKGSTYFIKNDKQELLGLLCINFDTDRYVKLADNILALTGLNVDTSNTLLTEEDKTNTIQQDSSISIQPEEILHSDVDEIISSSIDPQLLQPGVSMTPETKTKIVQELQDKGVFQIKGVMPHVAKIMGISEPSVYRYLRKIND